MDIEFTSPPAPSPKREGEDDEDKDDQQKLIKHVHELSYQIKFRPEGYFKK
jgi:hypothetical protein